MRVLYFSRDYTTHDRRFLLKIAEAHEVWFLRLGNDGVAYEVRGLPDAVRLVNWRAAQRSPATPDACLRLMPDLDSILNEVHPDLLHAGPVQSCGFMAALTGFHPFLLMSWGSDILVDADRDDLWRWATGYTLRRADMFLCDCDAVRAKARQLRLPYDDERILQFPWGIDLRQFAPGPDVLGLRNRPGWKNSVVILSTRSWEPIYGIDVLLDTFRRAYAQCPKMRLVLLGAGSLASTIESFIDAHGLKDVVDRPGMVPHERLPDYFRAVDAYLSCTLSDGTSISLLEALATGLPVVVTDAPGNREWVTPGENGWLAPAGNAEEFAEMLLRAASLSPSERGRVARRNRDVAEQHADWNVNSAKLLAAYHQLESAHVR